MKKNSQAFVNQLVVCLILTIGLGGGVGLGVVWMRHQISTTANRNRVLEAQHAEVERFITEKSAEIASAQRPELLRQANQQFKLGLVPWNDVPLINETSENAVRGLVQRATRDLMEAPPAVSFKLAQN